MCISKSPIILNRNTYSRTKLNFYDKPDVTLALIDGLLPITALNAPLEVTFPLADDAGLHYSYRLFWEDDPLGDDWVNVTQDDLDNPTRRLRLYVPTEYLVEKKDPANPTDKKYKLIYKFFNNDNQLATPSFDYLLEIDQTRPGLPDHGPMIFPREVEGGLTSAELTALGDQLDVRITSYNVMVEGDTIETWWGNIRGPSTTVTKEEEELQALMLPFTRAFLEQVEAQIGSGEAEVTYFVTDRALNISPRSEPAYVKLLLEDIPEDLRAPIVQQADDGLIDYQDAKTGVTVGIPHYDGAAPGDRIRLFWGDGNPLPELDLRPGDENKDPVLEPVLQFDVINLIPQGQVNVKYEVRRQGDLKGTSLVKPVTVFLTLPIPEEDLRALTLQGTSSNPNVEDNVIDPDDYELDARAIFRWVTGLRVGDFINLTWGEQQVAQWYEIKQSDFDAGVDFTIPISNRVIQDQGTGPAIAVSYTVTRTGNPNPANSPVQPVAVRSRTEQPGSDAGLLAPRFTRTTPGGVIGPIENPNGTPLHVDPYDNIKEGHTVYMTFDGYDRDDNLIAGAHHTDQREFDQWDIVNGYDFTIPDDKLRALCVGRAEATFRVIPKPEHNQEPATSLVGHVRVDMSRPGFGCA
ncbi:hypothetical protein HX776_12535 [Pseudomonas agarici]|uniref:hypothetical protein n=1 Tax=Pseudomonas agarici TaxID=46677 RepID=UPI0003174489|nr:hypothetical protein [Pseudomonas agarici]NWC09637.1 hypothetical protein [Pseudomonas agarici]SEL21352.1 hypothetical protein SAMN05216604_11343 [Pseudomonas agarici]